VREPPRLSAVEFNEILASKIETPGGAAFGAASDSAIANATGVPAPADGAFIATVHGGRQEVYIGGRAVSAADFARLLRQSDWKEGQNVLLASCRTGAEVDGFAQRLATILGVEVKAPATLAWSPKGQLPYARTPYWYETKVDSITTMADGSTVTTKVT